MLAASSFASSASNLRRKVLWIGGVLPRALVVDLGRHDLEVQATTIDLLDEHAPLARALVIEIPASVADVRASYGALIGRALDHGLYVALLPSDQEDLTYYYSVVAPITKDECLLGRVKAFYDSGAKLTDFISNTSSGPGANPALLLEGDVPAEGGLQLLLRRAFHDARCISLESLVGGKSGAQVWLVTHGTEDRAHRPLPMLVKVAELAKMHAEFSNAGSAANVISFRMLPPIHRERCVEGARLGLLVYSFLEKTIPFMDALQTHHAATLVSSLFGRTLDGCLAHSRVLEGNVAVPFIAMKAFRDSEALWNAFHCARCSRVELVDPAGLMQRLRALPSMQYQSGYGHGDLHTGNLFVASASPEVLVIDFGTFSATQPLVADFACLEVSVVFPADREGHPPRSIGVQGELRALYEFPLNVPSARGGSPRGRVHHDAVRAIRQAVRQVEPTWAAYVIAVAAYLVRFASYADNACVEERALAYELAVDLIVATESRTEGGAIDK